MTGAPTSRSCTGPSTTSSGFDVDTLMVEDQVLILPAGHPASRRASMTVAEATSIPDLPLPRWPRLDGTYPDGPGPELRDLTQVLQLVRLGRTAIVLPESARANLRDGLAVVPALGRAAGHDGHRLAAAQHIDRRRRPGAHRVPALTPSQPRPLRAVGFESDGRHLRGRVVQPDPLARTRRSIVFSHGSGHDQ